MARDAVVAVVWHGELGAACRTLGLLADQVEGGLDLGVTVVAEEAGESDRKSTRLNSSHAR